MRINYKKPKNTKWNSDKRVQYDFILESIGKSQFIGIQNNDRQRAGNDRKNCVMIYIEDYNLGSTY